MEKVETHVCPFSFSVVPQVVLNRPFESHFLGFWRLLISDHQLFCEWSFRLFLWILNSWLTQTEPIWASSIGQPHTSYTHSWDKSCLPSQSGWNQGCGYRDWTFDHLDTISQSARVMRRGGCARKWKGKGNVKPRLPSFRVKPFTEELFSNIVYTLFQATPSAKAN